MHTPTMSYIEFRILRPQSLSDVQEAILHFVWHSKDQCTNEAEILSALGHCYKHNVVEENIQLFLSRSIIGHMDGRYSISEAA